MKVTHRIPTTQYGYVEVEGTSHIPRRVREEHDELLAAFAAKPENTLAEKEMTDLIFKILHHTMDMNVEDWELCNPAQKTFLKLLKNAMLRKKP